MYLQSFTFVFVLIGMILCEPTQVCAQSLYGWSSDVILPIYAYIYISIKDLININLFSYNLLFLFVLEYIVK